MTSPKKIHPRPSTCMIESPEDLNSLAELKINQAAYMDNLKEADRLSDEGWALKNAAKDWRLVSESALHLRKTLLLQAKGMKESADRNVSLAEEVKYFQKEAVKFSTLYSREVSRTKKWLMIYIGIYVCFAFLLWIAG